MSTPPFGARVPGNDWWQLDGVRATPARTVSVVVVHHDQSRQLSRTLTALARQHYPHDRLEVIVVDDGDRRVAPRISHSTRLVRQEDRGFRLQLRPATSVRPTSDGAASCAFSMPTPRPSRGTVSGLTRLPALAPEAVTVGLRRHTLFEALGLRCRPHRGLRSPRRAFGEPRWLADAYAASRDLLDSDGPLAYRFVIGAVIACSRWFFDSVGGFDEGFVHAVRRRGLGVGAPRVARAARCSRMFRRRSPGTTVRTGAHARSPTGAHRRTPSRCGWRS